MSLIIITGTPGTGKTVIAQALAKKIGFELIDIKKIVNENKKIYNMENGERVVDLTKLKKLILKEIKQDKTVIIENHLLCELRLPAKFVFVLRCEPAILKKRLAMRKYQKKKIEENLLAEMLDYCTQLSRKNYKKSIVIELDTAKRNVNKCVAEIINVIKGRKKKIDDVDYSKELEEYAIGN